MFKYLQALLTWLQGVYSERDGSGSSTRVHIGLIIAFVLGVGVSFCVATHQHKMTVEQFNQFLGSGGLFIVTTGGPLYTANQVGNVFQKKEENKPQ